MSKTLKHCPFCGSQAEIYKKAGEYGVACKATDANYHNTEGVINEWCPADITIGWFTKEEDAIAIWNNRPHEETLENRLIEAGIEFPLNY